MYKLSTFLFVLFFSITFTTQSFSQAPIFTENFDSYIAGQQVACQNPTFWTTWSNTPCNATEDPVVSSTYSHSVSNSAKVLLNNDLVKDFGTAYTSGKYKISFQVYIPATKAGYFNTLATFAGASSAWALECYFDAGGAGRVNPNGSVPATFSWTADQWILVEHIVDLDSDLGELYINGAMVHTQQYTIGAYTSAVPLTLDANDFFGATAGDEMYFDDYELIDMLAPPPAFSDNFDSYIAGQQLACQNPIDWTTWSNAPCGAEDAFISSNHSYSGANSCVIAQNNDLVKLHGSKTTGIWYTSLLIYIPTGKSGYFNQMSGFTPNAFQWAMECYFDAGGGGRLVADVTTNFTWLENTWQQAIIKVDLDTHVAEFWFGNSNPLTMVYTWDWTRGGSITNRIDANDFFGATANDEMYMDNYYFGSDMPVVVPVELSAFTANVDNRNVVLNWTTESELNNQGFEIERKTAESQFVAIGHVQGNGTTTERKEYSFTDASVEAGQYFYRLKQVDYNGSFEYSNEVFAEVIAPPAEFVLAQNYPNPFNPTTSIDFSLAEPTFVKLAVYNLLGEVVEVLKNETLNAGSYNVTFDAASLPSGMYLYKIETAQFTSVRKMMLMK